MGFPPQRSSTPFPTTEDSCPAVVLVSCLASLQFSSLNCYEVYWSKNRKEVVTTQFAENTGMGKKNFG